MVFMTQIDTGVKSTWIRDSFHLAPSEPSWEELKASGLACYNWFIDNHNEDCFTTGGTCLVATVCAFDRTAARYRLFQGTISRGDRHKDMKRYGPTVAPRWWEAFERFRKGSKEKPVFHAEDSAIFNFERALRVYPGVHEVPLPMVVVGTMFSAGKGTKPEGRVWDLCSPCMNVSQRLCIVVIGVGNVVCRLGRQAAEEGERQEEQERERARW